MVAAIPADEEARLACLRSLRVLDTLPESAFDDLAVAAVSLLGVPIALVSLVDSDRQWFKAKVGLDKSQTSRDIAFCAHVILQTTPLIVPDATLDPRFADSPLVTGDSHIRFYAGTPIMVEGHAMGALCGLAREPRTLTDAQITGLSCLGRSVAALLSLRFSAERLAESERRFQAFLDNTPVVALLKDQLGQLRYVNRGFEKMTGRSSESVLGLTNSEWQSAAAAELSARGDFEVLRTGLPQKIEKHGIGEAGSPCIWQVIKFPVEVEGATWIGGVGVDVTQARTAEAIIREQAEELAMQNEALQETGRNLECALERARASDEASKISATRFEQLFAGLPVACFTYDAEGTIYEWNSAAERLWGIPAHEAVLRPIEDVVIGEAHHEDMREYVKRVFSGEAMQGLERQETLRNGSTRWLLTSTFPVWDVRGDITGAVSANFDITERKLAEHKLQESELQLRTVVRSIDEGLVVINADGRIVLWNPSAERMLGLTCNEIAGRSAANPNLRIVRTDGSDIPAEERTAVKALKTGEPQEAAVHGVFHSDGSVRWLSVSSTPIFSDGSRTPQGVISSFVDVTERLALEALMDEQMTRISDASVELELQKAELEDANTQLQRLATVDGLTGVRNHRTFQEQLDQELLRVARSGAALSLVIADVDHFKAFNDLFGHQAGDAVLKGVASLLESVSRVTDLVARYGGEEFVILMPETGAEGAVTGAERLRCALEEACWPNRAVTASFGVATLRPGMTKDELIKEADEALYESKENGRNRVTHRLHNREAASPRATPRP